MVTEGRRKLEKKNLEVVRFRAFQRENRKRKLDDEDVYEEINKYSNGSNKSIEDEVDFAKLKRMRYN